MTITNEMFYTWKKDPVTKHLIKAFSKYKEELERGMVHPDTLADPDCRAQLLRCLGMIEGIDLLLNLEVDQVVETEDEDNSYGT